MKTFTLIVFSAVFLIAGCRSTKNGRETYIPFTEDLKERLDRNNIDLREVQFYIDQKLTLTRRLGVDKAEVHSGVVKLENGEYVNEVIIPIYTPGICERVVNDGIYISFEKENNNLKFGRGPNLTSNYFTLYGKQWVNGTAEVTYDNQLFRASCATCNHAGNAKLVIKKSEFDKWDKKTRIVEGRKISKR